MFADEPAPDVLPLLADRIALMKPQITRLRADIACSQEVHGQERPGQPRDLLALKELLAGTNLEGASLASTKPANDAVFDLRNLVIATHLPVVKHQQLKNDLVNEPRYQRLTAMPPDTAPVAIGIERPILHAQIDIDHAAPSRLLHRATSRTPTTATSHAGSWSPSSTRSPTRPATPSSTTAGAR
ncbi:hypothetical protein ABT142_32705 [Streptomyces sp. NPDC001857]|uniref:hypothetical protein n=1 Tax=unclassified Streptomyces TaxID=2593676 RepID=UPI00332C6B3D